MEFTTHIHIQFLVSTHIIDGKIDNSTDSLQSIATDPIFNYEQTNQTLESTTDSNRNGPRSETKPKPLVIRRGLRFS